MSDFRELKAPKEGNDGWYIPTVTDSIGWLSINGDVTSDVSDTSIFYHDSELEAHVAGITYYSKYGQVYPYAMSTATSDSIPDESQVMVFE